MKKVCVVGHFGHRESLLNGQTIKTKNVTNELINQLGTDHVMTIDTHGGLKALPMIVLKIISAFNTCENIIILPAHNGIKVFVPLCTAINKVFHRKIHYVVIGGWLNKLLDGQKSIEKKLKAFSGIYVETETMKKALLKRGFDNIYVMPNFKKIEILSKEKLVYPGKEPYKLCTFSRVMKEKGIGDAVDVIKELNDKYERTACTLDIYGQVDNEQIEWFDKLERNFPEYINYRGTVSSDQSVDVLNGYYALLFPTKYYTEGIPGTIIDAYAVGVPVISAKWESFSDIVDDGITGIGYEFDNQNALKSILCNIIEGNLILTDLKVNCLNAGHEYTAEKAIQVLLMNL